jgi:hypothetical protein
LNVAMLLVGDFVDPECVWLHALPFNGRTDKLRRLRGIEHAQVNEAMGAATAQ